MSRMAEFLTRLGVREDIAEGILAGKMHGRASDVNSKVYLGLADGDDDTVYPGLADGDDDTVYPGLADGAEAIRGRAPVSTTSGIGAGHKDDSTLSDLAGQRPRAALASSSSVDDLIRLRGA